MKALGCHQLMARIETKQEESDKRGKMGGRAARRKTKVRGALGAAGLLPSVLLGHFSKPVCSWEPWSDVDGLDNLARPLAFFSSAPLPPTRPHRPHRPVRLQRRGRPDTPRLGCRQDPESGVRSGSARRALASALSLTPRRGTGHARRASGFGGERVSGRAAPDFTGGGGRGGLAQREAGAVLAREIVPLLPGADGGLAARGGLEGRGPGRGLSPGRLLPRPGSKRLRGKPRPRGRIRVFVSIHLLTDILDASSFWQL
ncbi:uncharacterized protein LOC113593097 [Acinonyx jubatus]|uniref:Uncharacterized protein LOC113593097 n=1 Tax=Acinonyx jubatus TaxID=32536 RepID=A0ABM3N832_ACIJB|nr:uncharacterized protein LOC113593097 [Acinonyx jubatus]